MEQTPEPTWKIEKIAEWKNSSTLLDPPTPTSIMVQVVTWIDEEVLNWVIGFRQIRPVFSAATKMEMALEKHGIMPFQLRVQYTDRYHHSTYELPPLGRAQVAFYMYTRDVLNAYQRVSHAYSELFKPEQPIRHVPDNNKGHNEGHTDAETQPERCRQAQAHQLARG